jgi:hypothetical protein
MYFLYGESVIYYFKHILLVDKVLLPTLSPYRKYIVVAKKYQFNDLVNRKFFSLLGILAILQAHLAC